MTEAPLPPPPPAEPEPAARIAAPWTGAPLVLGGVLAIVAGFLTYEKIRFPSGPLQSPPAPDLVYSFTGLGSETGSEGLRVDLITPGTPGRIVFIAGIIVLVLGLLVVARQGRLWVGVVATVVAAFGVVYSVLALVEPSRDARAFRSQLSPGGRAIETTGSIGIGALVGTAGALIALLAGVLAIAARRPTDPEPAPVDDLSVTTGDDPQDELAS